MVLQSRVLLCSSSLMNEYVDFVADYCPDGEDVDPGDRDDDEDEEDGSCLSRVSKFSTSHYRVRRGTTIQFRLILSNSLDLWF
ncbi:hypothetical protein Hdeb2414_s0026g00680311 [Helianthus debilis subsp. tardiflorus]